MTGPKRLARGGWCLGFQKMQIVRADHSAQLRNEEVNLFGAAPREWDWTAPNSIGGATKPACEWAARAQAQPS